VALRTGDSTAAERSRLRKRWPEGLVTTPESLSVLLSLENAHDLFADLETVIVDEWHELLATKRGVQTELALARLRTLAPGPPFLGVKPIAREEHRHADGCLASRTLACRRRVAPDRQRFHPGQRHGNADASEKRAPIQ
jgi:ATP-dependent Lhr-like helicase